MGERICRLHIRAGRKRHGHPLHCDAEGASSSLYAWGGTADLAFATWMRHWWKVLHEWQWLAVVYVALRAGDAAYGGKTPSNGEKGLSKAAIKVIKLLEHECGLREIATFIQHSNLTKLRNGIMASLIEAGFVELSQPDSPRSPTQKYRLTEKGRVLLKELGQEWHFFTRFHAVFTRHDKKNDSRENRV